MLMEWRSVLHSSFLVAESDDVVLRMVSFPYLQAQIDKLKGQKTYSRVLELGQFTKEEIEENRRKAQEKEKGKKAAPPKKVAEFRNVSKKVLEKKP